MMPAALLVMTLATLSVTAPPEEAGPAPLAHYGEIVVASEEAHLDLEASVETSWRLVLDALEVDSLALPDEVLADTWLVLDDLWLRLESLPWTSGDWTRVRLRVGTMERAEEVGRAEQLLRGLGRGLVTLREREAAERAEALAAERADALIAERAAAARIGAAQGSGLDDAGFRAGGFWMMPYWVPFHALFARDWWAWMDTSYEVEHSVSIDSWCFDPWFDPWFNQPADSSGGGGGWYPGDDDSGGGAGDDGSLADGGSDDGGGASDDDSDGGGTFVGDLPPLNPRIALWDGGSVGARPGPDGAGVVINGGGPSKGAANKNGAQSGTRGGGKAQGGSTSSGGGSGGHGGGPSGSVATSGGGSTGAGGGMCGNLASGEGGGLGGNATPPGSGPRFGGKSIVLAPRPNTGGLSKGRSVVLPALPLSALRPRGSVTIAGFGTGQSGSSSGSTTFSGSSASSVVRSALSHTPVTLSVTSARSPSSLSSRPRSIGSSSGSSGSSFGSGSRFTPSPRSTPSIRSTPTPSARTQPSSGFGGRLSPTSGFGGRAVTPAPRVAPKPRVSLKSAKSLKASKSSKLSKASKSSKGKSSKGGGSSAKIKGSKGRP